MPKLIEEWEFPLYFTAELGHLESDLNNIVDGLYSNFRNNKEMFIQVEFSKLCD
jgi:hypothetical protein